MRGDEFFVHVAPKPPFSKLHPSVAGFFKDYLAHEKVISFRDQFVVNTHFPPYPSAAFDNLVAQFGLIGEASARRLYSVTLAVTNRCHFHCWHCYNAGRSQKDVALVSLRKLVAELQDMGAVMVTLTGGEPLLREDLEDIVGSFDKRSCLTLGTTGAGLGAKRAKALRDRGLFAIGVSLDSADRSEHDRLRGVQGAFQIALDALRVVSDSGLYPYIISVATREFLHRDRFMPFIEFAGKSGAREVHLLEPSATGKLAGRRDVLLTNKERQQIVDYQNEIAQRDDLPILSSYTYLESSGVFGCGAGLTHLYIDGCGEVSPCQLVPLSFGNATRESFGDILDGMRLYFRKPRASCVGRLLARHIPEGPLPVGRERSCEICAKHLPKTHAVPRFFHIRAAAKGEVGRDELRAAYDRVHGDYDAFWLTEAAKPIEQLVAKIPLRTKGRVFEAGCGTGFATALIASRLKKTSRMVAVDLSEAMLAEARKRTQSKKLKNIDFLAGDALEILAKEGPFDLIFSSWVLGYIPLRPFFAVAGRALAKGGQLAFVVHKENSPREPLELFGRIVAQDPSVLQKRVAFDFPRDMNHVGAEMKVAALDVEELWDGNIVFHYETAASVLEHLLKSGAGTAFYDAIDPQRRPALEKQFLHLLAEGRKPGMGFDVIHDYVACIARKP